MTGGQSRIGYVWDVASGREIAQLDSQAGQLQDAAFSADGHFIATGSRGGTIAIWDTATGNEIRELKGHISAVSDVRFSPNGDTLLSTAADGTAKFLTHRREISSLC